MCSLLHLLLVVEGEIIFSFSSLRHVKMSTEAPFKQNRGTEKNTKWENLIILDQSEQRISFTPAFEQLKSGKRKRRYDLPNLRPSSR
jgi:hypothetical protein